MGPGRRLRAVPAAGAAGWAGRHAAVGRGAAGAGDRPRPHGQSPAAAAGRGLARPRADRGQAAVPGGAADRRERDHPGAGGAGRRAGAGRRRAGDLPAGGPGRAGTPSGGGDQAGDRRRLFRAPFGAAQRAREWARDSPMTWVNDVVQGLLLGGLYALFATGLSLVFGVMRLVNLAHGDLSIVAAFLALVAVDHLGVNPLVTLAVVVPLMFVLGYLLQRGLLNFTLRGGDAGQAVLPSILVTFGLAVVVQNLLLEVFSADSRGLDAGSIENTSIHLSARLAVGWFPLLTLLVAVGVLVGLQLLLSRTRLGRAFRATADDTETARLMGIDHRHLYALATAIALATVAVAGIFLGIRTTFTPSLGPTRLIFAFEAVIIGGLGSLWGTLVGGLILGVAQTVGAQISPGWGVLAGHLVFLAVLAFRPTGLLGRAAIA